jgi:hypothetical protein
LFQRDEGNQGFARGANYHERLFRFFFERQFPVLQVITDGGFAYTILFRYAILTYTLIQLRLYFGHDRFGYFVAPTARLLAGEKIFRTFLAKGLGVPLYVFTGLTNRFMKLANGTQFIAY